MKQLATIGKFRLQVNKAFRSPGFLFTLRLADWQGPQETFEDQWRWEDQFQDPISMTAWLSLLPKLEKVS